MTITHHQAELIAAAVSMLRPDWLASSLVTLITRDLAHWPLLDVACGLTYVALDRGPDGNPASKTPARVKEQGPWRFIGDSDPNAEAARERATRELAERKAGIAERNRAIENCTECGRDGRLPNGNLCAHDGPIDWRAQKVRTQVEAISALIRPPKPPIGEQP